LRIFAAASIAGKKARSGDPSRFAVAEAGARPKTGEINFSTFCSLPLMALIIWARILT